MKLVVNKTSYAVRTEELDPGEHYICLRDLWEASNNIKREHDSKPGSWTKQRAAQEFMATLREEEGVKMPLQVLKLAGQRGAGTLYAHPQVALAYAAFLAPSFAIAVNKVFRAHVKAGGKVPRPGEKAEAPPPPPATPAPAAPPPAPSQALQLSGGDLRVYERHLGRLVEQGLITREQARDGMTLAVREWMGIDLTNLPTLQYGRAGQPNTVPVPEGSTVVTPVNITEFPFNATDAGVQLRDLIDRFHKLTTRSKQPLTDRGLGVKFSDILRQLRRHPVALPSGYTPTPEEIELCRPLAKVVVLQEAAWREGQPVKVEHPHAYFSRAAVELVRKHLEDRIAILTAPGAAPQQPVP